MNMMFSQFWMSGSSIDEARNRRRRNLLQHYHASYLDFLKQKRVLKSERQLFQKVNERMLTTIGDGGR
jgi:hypothetical protein